MKYVSFIDHVSESQLPDDFKFTISWKKDNDVKICWHDVIVNFFNVVVFLLSSLVTGPSFMPISWLILELWQFSFIEDWPEIRNQKYPRLSFAQYMETGEGKGYQILRKCLHKKLLNTEKCQGYSFYYFWDTLVKLF